MNISRVLAIVFCLAILISAVGISEIPVSAQETVPPRDPENVIYLTFDDGPDPAWTSQILDILARYQAGATFYMIGYNVVSHPDIVQLVARNGQTIGVHGFNHIDLSKAGYNTIYYEIQDTELSIMDSLQAEPGLYQQFGRCFRPPYGMRSDLLVSTAASMNYEISMWNIDTKDWTGLSSAEIFNHFRSALEPYKVILMHDAGSNRVNTIEALQLILHELLMQGYISLPYCTQSGQAIKP
ncbi:MAG: polysaccharide deacetylase family protein [Anaerolineaceae bacterium]|jgi:peptidoglycan/xylan/chitin deacetylase (PgdA/CDA1 family)